MKDAETVREVPKFTDGVVETLSSISTFKPWELSTGFIQSEEKPAQCSNGLTKVDESLFRESRLLFLSPRQGRWAWSRGQVHCTRVLPGRVVGARRARAKCASMARPRAGQSPEPWQFFKRCLCFLAPSEQK